MAQVVLRVLFINSGTQTQNLFHLNLIFLALITPPDSQWVYIFQISLVLKMPKTIRAVGGIILSLTMARLIVLFVIGISITPNWFTIKNFIIGGAVQVICQTTIPRVVRKFPSFLLPQLLLTGMTINTYTSQHQKIMQ